MMLWVLPERKQFIDHTPMQIYFLCGALDEATRRSRSIDAANPAATQKVFNFCRELRHAGYRASVLSLGRGRQNGSGAVHTACALRTEGVAVVYACFIHRRWTTHLISALSVAALVWRLRRRETITLIAYNRLWHYVPALILARMLGIRCFLDLEDGFATIARSTCGRAADRCGGWLFDRLCSSGVLLANSALAGHTAIRHRTIWYGMLPELPVHADWTHTPLGVLLGGTLHEERGCRLFIDAIRGLMKTHPELRHELQFHVTGHGPMQAELEAFSHETGGWVIFAGLAERASYIEILGRSHVGLMLNLSSHEMSRTTFPSKVLEYAAAGLLVVATPVSDVPAFFQDDAAILLTEETPRALTQVLVDILGDRAAAAATAARGSQRVHDSCASPLLTKQLVTFLDANH